MASSRIQTRTLLLLAATYLSQPSGVCYRPPVRRLLLALGLSLFCGCMQPPSNAARLTEAAREMNLAARFGRLDLAAEHTANGAREHFLKRRVQWGGDVRVVDVQLSGLDMKDDTNAVVHVDVAWMRMNEGELKVTRVGQQWQERKSGWRLVRERRVSGDLGLFGEPMAKTEPKAPSPDVHFPSKTIR